MTTIRCPCLSAFPIGPRLPLSKCPRNSCGPGAITHQQHPVIVSVLGEAGRAVEWSNVGAQLDDTDFSIDHMGWYRF